MSSGYIDCSKIKHTTEINETQNVSAKGLFWEEDLDKCDKLESCDINKTKIIIAK